MTDDYISRQMLGTNLAKVGTNSATKRTVKGFPIDADLLMLKVEEKYGFRARDRLYEIIRYMPKYELPAADVAPVVHGVWLDGYKMQTCSLCKCRGKKSWTFCPHCGARMIYGERKE